MTDSLDSTAPAIPGRTAGLRGARESHEPRLLLSTFRDKSLSAPIPATWSGKGSIPDSGWGMDGNDQYGDCGAAATDHGRMAKANDATVYDGLGRPYFSGTVATYAAYGTAMGEPVDPNSGIPDQGVANDTWLGFLYQNGLIDGYGEVPLDEIDEYAYLFGGVLLAVALDDNAEQEFERGLPWGGIDDQPDPSLGHDIWMIAYDQDGSLEVVTWGAVQKCTPTFRRENITDAWVFLDSTDARRAGVNWEALQAALTDIHGVQGPTTPEPVPTPPMATEGFLATLEHDIKAGVAKVLHEIADSLK